MRWLVLVPWVLLALASACSRPTAVASYPEATLMPCRAVEYAQRGLWVFPGIPE